MSNSINREFLAKKLLCTCPICQKRIYGNTLGIEKLDMTNINKFPFAYTYVHACESNSNPNQGMELEIAAERHAVTLFFDANLTVRGIEQSPCVKID